MNRIKIYLNSLTRGVRVSILALAVVFLSAGIAQAATTISTNILTNGTLGATGVSTFGGTASTTISVAGVLTTPVGATALFLGGASTTQFTLLSGDTIKNAAASTTAISGSVTADANVTLLNTQAATSTLTAACVITTATSSATKIRLMFNNIATTSSTINGATVQGYVLWSYGSNCTN